MKKELLIFLSVMFFFKLITAQKSEQMKWMVGSWKTDIGSGYIIEQWRVVNDSTLTGKSFFVQKVLLDPPARQQKDTILQETIELAFRNGSWHYIPTVKNQNNAQPVSFKFVFLKDTEFISENPAHDFPQRIAYRRIKNQLFASIEGKRNGKYVKQNFDFSNQ